MSKKNRGYKLIGIVCAGLHDTGAQNTMLALIKEVVSRGDKVIVFTNFTYYHIEYTSAEVQIFKLITKPALDGLILMPESIKNVKVWESVLSDVKAAGVPFVCIDRDVPDCVSVTFDYGGAFEQVMRHMIEVHGPKRINFIGGMENNSFSEERLNVFKKVLADNGREFDPERFGYGQFWESPTQQVLDRFYSSGNEPPDAILCVNDTEAMTVCSYLRNRGIEVPGDVIVSGFDGIDEEKYTYPRLTTAEIDLNGMAHKAVELLEELMAGKTPKERLAVIPYKLRISQSCGCRTENEKEKLNKLLELYLDRKNLERHERRMFEYSACTTGLESYDALSRLMPEFCESPVWCCIERRFLQDMDSYDNAGESDDHEVVMVMHCDNHGEMRNEDSYIFDVPVAEDEFLPGLDSVFDEYDALLAAPLSYQGELMGYLADAIDAEGFSFMFTQRLITNTNHIFETLKTKIRLQKAYAKVADMHMRDPMTGIYNRRGFYMKMAELTESGCKDFQLFSVDLDRLKFINDNFGHYTGDRAIITAADIIRRAAGETAVCARFGGDEFIVVIPGGESADSFMERVNADTSFFNSLGSEKFELGVSIGSAVLKITDRENIDAAMKAADERMYECKRQHHSRRT